MILGMVQENVADKLRKPRRPWRALLAGGVVAVAAVSGFGISAAINADTSSQATSPVALVGGQGKPTAPQISHKLMTPHQAKTTTPPPPPEPEPVYVPPAAGGSNSNSGALVPFIASSDPNNASGGDYLDPGSYCTSGSASGFPPRCD